MGGSSERGRGLFPTEDGGAGKVGRWRGQGQLTLLCRFLGTFSSLASQALSSLPDAGMVELLLGPPGRVVSVLVNYSSGTAILKVKDWSTVTLVLFLSAKVSPLLKLSPSLLSAVQAEDRKEVRDRGPGLRLPEPTSSCLQWLAVSLGRLQFCAQLLESSLGDKDSSHFRGCCED